MCNLSEGVYEKRFEKVIEQTIERIVTSMLQSSKSMDEIENLTGLSHDDLLRVMDKVCQKS